MSRPDTLFRVVCEKGHVTYHPHAPWLERDLCAKGRPHKGRVVACAAPLVTLDRYECVTEPEAPARCDERHPRDGGRCMKEVGHATVHVTSTGGVWDVRVGEGHASEA